MSNLMTQTKNINIVISIKDTPLYNFTPYLEKWLVGECETYAYIIHDKDIDENGVLKTKHCHIVAVLFKRKRLKQCIGELCEICNINANAISIEKASNIDASIQYLIHKGHLSKYQYDVKDIVSNIDYDDLNDILNDNVQAFDFDTIKEICILSIDERDYLRRVWKWYGRYWRILDKMWLWYGKGNVH